MGEPNIRRPAVIIEPKSIYRVVLETTRGVIVCRLYADGAFVAVNHFVSLARARFFDGNKFFRASDHWVQAGDRTGAGSSGCGYVVEDDAKKCPFLHKSGTLSLVNVGANLYGSQFLLTRAATHWLNGRQIVFGEIESGFAISADLTTQDAIITAAIADLSAETMP